MTYRERREARAERLREWADKRETKGAAELERSHELAEMIPFGQPVLAGHHSQKRHLAHIDRIRSTGARGLEDLDKGREMNSRADTIEAQDAHAIYSDDVDAVERLEARIAELEQQRETMKARNAAYRKEHRDELKTMGAYDRAQAMPHAPYELQNLGGNITRNRKRLEELKRRAVVLEQGGRGRGRPMLSRYPGECPECGESIERGAAIVYYKLTREALHAACDEKKEG